MMARRLHGLENQTKTLTFSRVQKEQLEEFSIQQSVEGATGGIFLGHTLCMHNLGSTLTACCGLSKPYICVLRAPYFTTSTLSDIKVCLLVYFVLLALSRKVFYLSLKLTSLSILFHEYFLPRQFLLFIQNMLILRTPPMVNKNVFKF